MRVALAGKGGAGKTTLSATLARLLAREGNPVVAIDADSNPNLAAALGVDRSAAAELGALPSGLISRRLDGGPALKEPVRDVVQHYGLEAPDGVRLLHMGMPEHADEGCLCSAHATVSALLGDLGTWEESTTIVDLEASPEHLSRGTTRHVDALLLVAEPYYRALETVRRMAELATGLPVPRVAAVVNKVRTPGDEEAVRDYFAQHGIEMVAAVPWNDAVLDADRDQVPVIDRTADDVVDEVRALAKRLAEGVPAADAS